MGIFSSNLPLLGQNTVDEAWLEWHSSITKGSDEQASTLQLIATNDSQRGSGLQMHNSQIYISPSILSCYFTLLQSQIFVINSKCICSPPDTNNRLFVLTFQSHQDMT